MKKTADAVIIGAGIHGASVAYHLSKAGMKDIVILEALSKGGLSTRPAADMVMHQTGNETLSLLAKFSIQKYAKFKDELGVDINFKRIGSIVYATTEKGTKSVQKFYKIQNKLDIKTELIDSSMLEKKTDSLIAGKEILKGSYCPSDAYIEAIKVVETYINYAINHGAELYENVRITNIYTDKGKIDSVETDTYDKISTRIVVNCAGGWAKDIGRLLGIYIPIKNNKRNIALLQPNIPLIGEIPITENYETGWYFLTHNQTILAGVSPVQWIEDKDRLSRLPFEKERKDAIENYVKVNAPKLYPAKLVGGWAGYRPMVDPNFADGLPILGPVEGIDGYYNSCGWGEFGITHGAIGGELVSQIILNQSPLLAIEPFLLSRFNLVKTS